MSERLFLDEVRRFEDCEYALEEFGHGEHLKVAWTYLHLYGYEGALARMRAGLLRFSMHHNKTGYNETITVFWMRKLQEHRDDDPGKFLCNADKEMLFRHYTRERVMSDRAKQNWIEPDLLPM
jgi:hypothetical protein